MSPAVQVAAVSSNRSVGKGSKKSARASAINKCSAIAAVLMDAQPLPESVRVMLRESTPWGLDVSRCERHPYQTKVVGMVGKALAAVEAHLLARVHEVEQAISRSGAEREAGEARHTIAQSTLEACTKAAKSAHEAKVASVAAIQESKSELAKAESEQRVINDELAEAVSGKELLKNFFRRTLPALRDGSIDLPTAGSALASLPSSFHESLPSMLLEGSSEVSVDGTTLLLLESELSKHLEESREAVSRIVDRRVGIVATVNSRKAEVLASEQKQEACESDLQRALAEQRDSQVALRAAAKAVRQLECDSKRSADARDEAESRVTDLRKGSIATFRELEGEEPARWDPSSPAASALGGDGNHEAMAPQRQQQEQPFDKDDEAGAACAGDSEHEPKHSQDSEMVLQAETTPADIGCVDAVFKGHASLTGVKRALVENQAELMGLEDKENLAEGADTGDDKLGVRDMAAGTVVGRVLMDTDNLLLD